MKVAALVLAVLALAAAARAEPMVRWVPGSTQRLAQLTGDRDVESGAPTRTLTGLRAGLAATDLGSTLEHNGSLIFLFGDSWGRREGDRDAMAVSSATDPRKVDLEFPVDAEGVWRPVSPPGLEHGAFCVPSHGVSHRGSLVVLYTQPAEGDPRATMRRSFLVESRDGGATWATLYPMPNGDAAAPRFVNGYFVRRDGFVYLFGSGKYRASSPTLARADEARFPARDAWQFFAGVDDTGATRWCSSADQSVALFAHDVVGELSCEWIGPLQRWVMLYNSSTPRGIAMRSASQPWGPWSEAEIVFDPHRDGAYGHWMHVAGGSDTAHDPGRENEWGGEYAPYVIPRFVSGDGSRCELVYTMSTWNPYAVVLMRSVVGVAPGDGFGLANPAVAVDPSPRP